MTNNESGLVDSLPSKPLLESTIDQLTAHEEIGDWESTLAFHQPEVGEELVFNFVIEISGNWHALVLHQDGENGWKSLGAFKRFGKAGREISEWREKPIS